MRTSPPCGPGTPRPCPAFTPDSVTVSCCPGSTFSTVATFPSRCYTAPCATTRSNSSARPDLDRTTGHGPIHRGPVPPTPVRPVPRPACLHPRHRRPHRELPPRPLHELQARARADQQDPQWKRLYATRSGAECTICEFINAHQARRSSYHRIRRTHVQHVLPA
ncbi:transposase [Streptomyces sp. NPDC021056]|uniref:transposase n=1 Tax=Streptomyces sp. NPDC021056 TaxID=3155012 RepID=UPI0033E6306B